MTNGQCRQFRDCTLSRDQYIELLRSKNCLELADGPASATRFIWPWEIRLSL